MQRVGWAKAAKISPHWLGAPFRRAHAATPDLMHVGTADPARCINQRLGAAFAHPTAKMNIHIALVALHGT